MQNRTRTEFAQRFWARVAITTLVGCWEWTGHRVDRYGRINLGPRFHPTSQLTHRVAWMLAHGRRVVPTGLCVCHSCDNGFCCNPEHLFLGTQLDNVRDRDVKGRQRSARGDEHYARREPWRLSRGEGHYKAKLTEGIVLEIRRRFKKGEAKKALAREFGLAPISVSRIVDGRAWNHLPL